ncbi:MAG: UDP-3-O-(3-hydroxymyristoyl)glucosamine N-acyltransferase, partial [Saprospiraceae bacterium]|nr:UDP-3-O-(3-hydroxymyristoyl)glucosamine N-acyltransferase [Saprospiraceae bacterium]
VKLDNLIQVGHNVEIGENTVVAAQAGIAGSTKIGKNCRIGGQVGFVGHLTIADGTSIQAQSGIAASVKEPNTSLFGYPAIQYRDYIRSYAVFKKLPDLYKKISKLERILQKLGK